MPRKLRIEYPGAIYHVMNRGNQRQNIFLNDLDRHLFLETLSEASRKTGWQIHAYCLMRNHFHLVLETPHGDLAAGMKWFLGTYTKRFNIRHKTCGHLFAGRYKALPVDGSGNGYLQTACDYVHLNPIRARLISPEEPLERFQWSSYPAYIAEPSARPDFLRVDRLLGEKGIPRDSAAGRLEFARRMQQRAKEGIEGEDHYLAQGAWFVGGEEFKRELLAAMEGKAGPNHLSMDRQETGKQRAERLICKGLQELSWEEKELIAKPKGDSKKLELARILRENPPITLQWIADRLRMGSGGYVNNLLLKQKKSNQRTAL